MADNFEASLKMVLKHGFVDHPKDPGGQLKRASPTNGESFLVDLWRVSMSLLKSLTSTFKKFIGYGIGIRSKGMTFLLALIFLFLIGV